MGIDVTGQTWETEVIAASVRVPVLVDFWAEWCGPCRMLGPVLEKLELAYEGRFRLVKVNTDLEQDLARRFRVSGIPDVKLFINGAVRDQFTGALPEPAVRRFLDSALPDPELDAVVRLAETDPVAAAEEIFDKKIRRPVMEEILWRAVLIILSKGSGADRTQHARRFLGELPELGSSYSEGRGRLLAFLDRHAPESDETNQLTRLLRGDSRPALDFFLDRVEHAARAERERRRDDLLACFFALGVQDPLVNEYRRKLSAVLF